MRDQKNNSLQVLAQNIYDTWYYLAGYIFFYTQIFCYQLPSLKGAWWLGVYSKVDEQGILAVLQEAYALAKTHSLGLSYFRLGSGPVLMITQPEHIRAIMVQHSAQVVRHEGLGKATAQVFGSSIFYRDARRWKCRRHSWRTTLFSPSSVQQIEAKVSEIIHSHIMSLALDSQKPIELRYFFSQLVLDVIGQTLLHHPSLPEFAVQLTQLLEEGLSKTNSPREVLANHFSFFIRLFQLDIEFTDFKQLRKKIRDFFEDNIINLPDVKKQVLATLLSSCVALGMCDDNNPQASILDESLFLLVASHHTTVQTLIFLVLYLNQHPKYTSQLNDALSRVSHEETIRLSQIESVDVLDHIIQETLRLAPPIPFLHRNVKQSFTINTARGKLTLPQQLDIIIPSFLLHRASAFFDEPNAFYPERFSNTPQTKNIIDFSFGIGPQSCVGKRFALQEIKLIIAYLYSRYQIVVLDNTLTINPHQVTLALCKNPCAYFHRIQRPHEQAPAELLLAGHHHDKL